MAIKHGLVPVGTGSTLLVTQDTGYGQGQAGESICVQNPSSTVTVYLGGTGVTTASYGFALGPLSSLSVDLADGEALYGVVDTVPTTVSCLYQGA